LVPIIYQILTDEAMGAKERGELVIGASRVQGTGGDVQGLAEQA
jgi:hypothetical protein